MPIKFNSVLLDAGIRAKDVCLVRHKDAESLKGRSIYSLWRNDPNAFELYQSVQKYRYRKVLSASYWAVFLVDPNKNCMFVGLYRAQCTGWLASDMSMPNKDELLQAGAEGQYQQYQLTLSERMSEFIGRLFIAMDERAMAQSADLQNKDVTELRTSFQEAAFPGFLDFIEVLSNLEKLPPSWSATLRSSKGVYLLCGGQVISDTTIGSRAAIFRS